MFSFLSRHPIETRLHSETKLNSFWNARQCGSPTLRWTLAMESCFELELHYTHLTTFIVRMKFTSPFAKPLICRMKGLTHLGHGICGCSEVLLVYFLHVLNVFVLHLLWDDGCWSHVITAVGSSDLICVLLYLEPLLGLSYSPSCKLHCLPFTMVFACD